MPTPSRGGLAGFANGVRTPVSGEPYVYFRGSDGRMYQRDALGQNTPVGIGGVDLPDLTEGDMPTDGPSPTPSRKGGPIVETPTANPSFDDPVPTRIAAGGAPGDMELPGDFFGGIRLNGLSGMAQYMNTQRNPINPPAGQVSTDQTARDAYLAAQRAKNGQPTVPPDNSSPTRLATGGVPGSLTGSQIFGGNPVGPVAASPFSLPGSSYNPSSPGQANVYVGDRLSSSQPYNAGSGNIPTAVAPAGQPQAPMTIGQKMQEGARNAGVASAPSGSIASGMSGYGSAANANAYYGFGSGGDAGSSAAGGISMGGGVFNMDFAQGGGGWITHSIVTMSG